MRKLLSVVFVLALAFSAANAQLGDGVKIYGDGQIYLYGGTIDSGVKDTTSDKKSRLDFIGNLSVSKKFDATGGTGVLHLRGSSSDADGTFKIGNIRGGIDDNYDANVINSNFWIKELYYIQPVADNFVVFTIGKTAYLGNNSGYGALTAAFTDDSVLAEGIYAGKPDGANRDTIKFDINPIDQLTISYGYSDGGRYQNNGNDIGFGYDGYHAVQVNIKPIAKTNLRFGYAVTIATASTYKDKNVGYAGEGEGASAFYFGGDTAVVDNFTFFAKFSVRLDETNKGAIGTYENATVKRPVGLAWQIGSKIGGGLWGRNADAAFVGIGGAGFKTNEEFDDKITVDGQKEDIPMEIHIEVNYAYSLDGGLVLTPFVAFATGIVKEGGAGSVSGTGFAGGLKLGFTF